MTVIAWDGVTLAADRLCSDGRFEIEVDKLFYYLDEKGESTLKCGIIAIAIVGYPMDSMEVKEWLENGKAGEFPKPAQSNDFSERCLAFYEDRIEEYAYSKIPMVFKGDDFLSCRAWGSGAEIASGAMWHGSTAKNAVKICIENADGCGKGIDWIKVNYMKTVSRPSDRLSITNL